jgi:hypothetical protein
MEQIPTTPNQAVPNQNKPAKEKPKPAAVPTVAAPLVSLSVFNTPKQETTALVPVPKPQPYFVISVPTGGEPKLHNAKTRKVLKQILRYAYAKTDQQFLYVLRGELAELFKIRNGLSVRFGSGEEIHVTNKLGKQEPVQDGWLGD